MIWIVIALIAILSLVTVSLVFGSSTYSSMPGTKIDLSFLGEDELLIPEYDAKQYVMIDDKHKEVFKSVVLAKGSYNPPYGLEATSDALLQAVEHYEAIREQAESAVVELNLASLARARLKVHSELGASQKFMDQLNESLKNALGWADWFLHEKPDRYKPEVKARYNKLKPVQDARA